jgi:hypothetical protein
MCYLHDVLTSNTMCCGDNVQALVRALERLSQPELEDDPFMKQGGGKGGKKVATISRSNEGCFRTRVCCPRCKQQWSEGECLTKWAGIN